VLKTGLTALVADLVALVVLREINYVGGKMQTGDVEVPRESGARRKDLPGGSLTVAAAITPCVCE